MERIDAIRAELRRQLLAWYRRHARDLPWRRGNDPYAIWLSEVILQQTRVEQGLPYYERFLLRFPRVEDLARAKTDEVLKLWEGLGYYARARKLHEAAQVVMERGLPETVEDWEALPGIGRYTAGAIASIAFDQAVPAVDGNVKRVLSRVLDVAESIDEPRVSERLWDAATELVRGASPGSFNQALMELGAGVCKPKNPNCEACPIESVCLAAERGTRDQRPVRNKKKAVPHHQVVVAAIRKNGRYLLGKRPPKGLLGGLWEFPGGKVEPGEDPVQALVREVKEELGIETDVGDQIASVNHAYTHFKVTLSVYRCKHTAGQVRPNAHTEVKWVLPKDFDRYAFPKANHKFLDLL